MEHPEHPDQSQAITPRRAELDLEHRQLVIREEELRLRDRELELNTQFANRSLDAQERDRSRFWDWMADQNRRSERLIVAVLVSAIVFVAMALYAGHPELVEKILYAIFGGLGGYGIGRSVRRKEPPGGEATP